MIKEDGVYIYSIMADSSNPIQSMNSFDLLFLCEDNKLKWLQMFKNLRFCIPRTKENGDLFDSINDFLDNPPKDFEITLNYKYKIIERKSNHHIGEYHKNIYRPVISYKLQCYHLIFDEMPLSDCHDDISMWGTYRAEYLSHIRQLELILDDLKSVFKVIEPTEDNKKAYGNTLRNIIILSCTEIDAMMKKILKINNFIVKDDKYSTNHYYNLKDALRLDEYEVKFMEFEHLGSYDPFSVWDSEKPTQSLAWYDAYNKIKHDREVNFCHATLENALRSITAYAILLIAQYGLDNSIWKDHMKKIFSIQKQPRWKLEDFYVPHITELTPIPFYE